MLDSGNTITCLDHIVAGATLVMLLMIDSEDKIHKPVTTVQYYDHYIIIVSSHETTTLLVIYRIDGEYGS
jgi:hypothetical protein